MFKSLNTSMLGLRVSNEEALALAQRHGFAGIDFNLREMRDAGVTDTLRRIGDYGLRPGVAGGLLPVRLAVDDQEWQDAMAALPGLAELAQAAGFTRTTIVMLPFHDTLPFERCFALCVSRLQQSADMLGRYGLAVGVEYVAPRSRRAGKPNVFLHDLAGTLSLLDAVGRPNAGLLLDSFHWYCAGESAEALRALPARRIMAVHLCDAPDRPLVEQVATERAVPGEGVADLRSFCAAVTATGYDGPITCEPFCKALETLPPETVAARVSAALTAMME